MNEFPDDIDSEISEDQGLGSQAGFQFGLDDRYWNENRWSTLLEYLIKDGILSWRDIATLVIGHLNPSQVGTGLASSAGFKRRYGKGQTMRVVMSWFYSQPGRCEDCGNRLELQADHVQPREAFVDPLDADFIENMVLRCRRCNVIRRPSHRLGGQTFLTAEAALMWILLVIRPLTFNDFVRCCRIYGMTMSDIRMQEAWAMAHWLSRMEPPRYELAVESNSYDLLLWPDNAITRRPAGAVSPSDPEPLYQSVRGDWVLGFLASSKDTSDDTRFYELPVSAVPFSTYELGDLPRQALAISYVQPKRSAGVPQKIVALPPRGRQLIVHAVRSADDTFEVALAGPRGHVRHTPLTSDARGRRRDFATSSAEPLRVVHESTAVNKAAASLGQPL